MVVRMLFRTLLSFINIAFYFVLFVLGLYVGATNSEAIMGFINSWGN